MKRDLKREAAVKIRNGILGEIARKDPTRLRERVVLSEDEKLVASRARRKAAWRRKGECDTG